MSIHRTPATLGLVLLLLCSLNGCVLALLPPNPPQSYQLRLPVSHPDRYQVRFEGQPLELSSEGRFEVSVPSYRPACPPRLFGKISLPQRAGREELKSLHILKNGRVVARLSLKMVGRLPQGADGTRTLPASNY